MKKHKNLTTRDITRLTKEGKIHWKAVWGLNPVAFYSADYLGISLNIDAGITLKLRIDERSHGEKLRELRGQEVLSELTSVISRAPHRKERKTGRVTWEGEYYYPENR